MPKVKTENIHFYREAGLGIHSVKITYNVNTSGDFYVILPEELRPAFEEGLTVDKVSCRKNRAGKLTIYSDQMHTLTECLEQAIENVNKPEVITEHVIRYNIESHVSFAEDTNGNIFPNAGYPDCHWPNGERFGGHHAAKPSQGGYSLIVGAKACTKITTKFGQKNTVRYENYCKGGSHRGKDNPAEKLNSWASMELPKNCKEMPYSDDAATFFHRLMLGMAKLCKDIQDVTFNENDLLEIINGGSPLLLASLESDK